VQFMNIDALTASTPYSLPQKEKEKLFLPQLKELTAHHQRQCPEYARLLALFYPFSTYANIVDIPYLPVRLFKTRELSSIPEQRIFKILQSSGTTSSTPSKIFLDAETAQRQTKALADIMTAWLGPKRLPMVIIDHANVIHDRHQYNARGAAIVGMLTFGRNVFYALNENMELDIKGLTNWLEKYQHEQIVVFGLTYLIWKYCLAPNLHLPIYNGVLFHTGGWKRLEQEAVSNERFKELVKKKLGITSCHNFYGMVEQVGSIFVECEQGRLHCPHFADVVIRHPKTWKENPVGEVGVVQALSLLPTSYPGHSLLTEDLGVVDGIDNCPCGRKGKCFRIIGRVAKAELRGCSDTVRL